MKSYMLAGAAIAARAMLATAVSTDATGVNSYCDAVDMIALTNFGQPDQYQDVIDLSGGCNQKAVSYGGGIAPHDEQTSLHFRGPLKLKQFAAYYPGGGKVKREEALKHSRHGHAHFHKRETELREELQKREAAAEANAKMGDMVTAMINGKPVTFPCTWAECASGDSAAAPAPASSPSPTPDAKVQAVELPSSSASSSSAPAVQTPSTDSSPKQSSSGGSAWSQTAYYSAEKQTASGLVFLADNQWSTATLGFIDSTGTGSSKTPSILADTTIPNNVQFMIFSDKKCSGSGAECGFYNGDIAYHGFDGPKKAFFFEFQMPSDNSGAAQNVDMPSIWALNAKIPRLGQYSPCSCWATGCGEIDLFEVLAPGSDKCVQAVHAAKGVNKNSGTPCNYFKRPTSKTIKAATIYDTDAGSVTTVILPNDTSFDQGFSADQISGFLKNASNKSKFEMLS